MEIYKSFDKKQRIIIVIAILLSVLCIIAGIVYDSSAKEIRITRLARPDSYEDAKNVSFTINVEGIKDDENFKYSGQLAAKKLEENEIDLYLNKALDQIEKTMFRVGENCNRVLTGVNIPAKLPKNPVRISFSTDESGILLENGNINFEQVKEAKKINIKILTSYDGKEAYRNIAITIFPKQMEEDERIKLKVSQNIDSLLADEKNKIIELPNEVEGHKINAFFPKEEITGNIVGFTFVIIICIFVVFNEKNKKKIKDREEELRNGYTEFVGRFVILLGAGLSISAVWKKLESGFNSNKSLNKEIKFTLWETGNGKTEREAYENFGRRIGGTQYVKFVSIINQSLKLGSGQLLNRLEAESEAAMFE